MPLHSLFMPYKANKTRSQVVIMWQIKMVAGFILHYNAISVINIWGKFILGEELMGQREPGIYPHLAMLGNSAYE